MSNATHYQNGSTDAQLGSSASGCQAVDLKGLLNAIVSQISDADRRHSDTLHQMQDRLSSLGRDARVLRARVPDQFQAAFDRIEAGMSELAVRIAEAQSFGPHGADGTPVSEDFAPERPHAAPYMPAETRGAPPYFGGQPQNFAGAATAAAHMPSSPEPPHSEDAPMALRSAQAGLSQPMPQFQPKTAAGIDTFDVIESLPGDVSDPWDRDAAAALASVYDDSPRPLAQDPYAASAMQLGETPRVYAPPAPPAAPAAPSVDTAWLEKRFSEISERIEASLADLNPDQSFFALGQRLDQFERSFAQALDNVATRNDVESVRLIEQHMVELVTHLENTQVQLARFDVIEEQIGTIAQRLSEVQALAEVGRAHEGSVAAEPAVDMAALARAAAQEAAAEAASRFAALPQQPASIAGLDDMRRLMEHSISSARQSEENTTALLDTLQQAMIRLLDRMDAIEFNQHQSSSHAMAPAAAPAPMPAPAPAPAAAQKSAAPSAFMTPEYEAPARQEPRGPSRPKAEPAAGNALDDAVAAVASKAAPRTAPAQAPAAPQAEARSSDKLRQDFIADARRAKMRLSGEGGEPGNEPIVVPAPAAREGAAPAAGGKPAAGAPRGKPAVTVTVTQQSEPKPASAVSPRVVALSVALALAGAAYMMMPFGKSSAPMATTAMPGLQNQAAPEAAVKSAASNAAAPSLSTSSASPVEETRTSPQEQSTTASDAPPPEADFSKPAPAAGGEPQLNLHQTEGHIVQGDMTVGALHADRPLHGIAVAAGTTGLDKVARAQRDQAMANVSNRLGEVAATNPAAVSPVALDLASPEATQTPTVTPGRSSALDMPPANVGPLSLRLAAANGDASAQFEVGARLAEGKGTDQNFKDAAKWYQRAAAQGFAQAQYRLGTLYERGLGLKADEARAKEWYLSAAEQGNMKAMHNLAVLSANAKSGTPDYTTAAKWFTDAAERGLADSQFNLAVLYENGLGVDPDMRQAYKWLALAARGGDKEAGRRRDIMKGKLTASELAQAEALAKEFRARVSDPLVNDARTAGEAWKRNPANGQNG